MKRLFNRFYYLTETLLMRSAAYQLLLVALVIIGLSVVGGGVVHFAYPVAYRDTTEAIWWAFLRLTDPGYLGDDHGVVPRVVSTFLTLAGYVVFLGALVAIMTTWLDRLMAFLGSGRSPIFERRHILIIGWNDRIHALVEEVVHSSQRLLDLNRRPAVVILCEPFSQSMHRELLQKLDPAVRRQCRLLVRSGNPLEAESLERVDYTHARSVILISQARGERADRQLADMTLAKVLMTLKAKAPDLEFPPNVVVEVSNPTNKLLLESVGWENHTEAIVGEEILGRLFCQAVRFPGLSKVYRRLLTDSFRDSILLVPASSLGIVGQSMMSFVHQLPQGIPIGSLPIVGVQSQVRLLDFDSVLTEEDLVVLVSSAENRRGGDSSAAPACSKVTIEGLVHPPVRRILCVGWSTLVAAFLGESTDYKLESFEVTLLWDKDLPRERERLQRLETTHSNLKLTFLLGALSDDDEVRRLKPETFDTIILLSDQRRNALLSDAETVLHYVLLDRHFRALAKPVWFVVELHDEDNRPLIAGRDVDVILSGEIISHLLAQVAIHRSLAWIYEELFSKGGSELRLLGLDSFSGYSGALDFATCQSVCLTRRSVAVGIRREESVLLHPSPAEPFSGDDKLIVVEWEEVDEDRQSGASVSRP